MDELELLKKDWEKSTKNYPNLNKQQLCTLIHKRSSSIVKWIFIISVLEFSFWTLCSLMSNFEKARKEFESYNVDSIFYPMVVIGYIVIFYFMYLFYKNYRNISTTENIKTLMERIIKTRQTVKYYVIFNLIFMCIAIILSVCLEVTKNPEVLLQVAEIEAKGANGIYIFYFIIVLCTVIALFIMTAVLIVFYYLIYGLLLKRLKSNYKDLKKLEAVK